MSALLAACAVAGGCAGYRPAPIDTLALSSGAATEHRDGISVSVFVPGDDQV